MFVMQSVGAQDNSQIVAVENLEMTNEFIFKEIQKLNKAVNNLAIPTGPPDADCEAKAKCGGSVVTCNIKGDGICTGTDGVL